MTKMCGEVSAVFSAGCSCRTSVDSSATSGCYSATSHAAAAAVVSSEKSFLDTGSCSSPDDVDILSCDYPVRQVVPRLLRCRRRSWR